MMEEMTPPGLTRDTSAESPAPAGSDTAVQQSKFSWVDLAGVAATISVVLLGMLFYLGWARTHSQWVPFGIDTAMLHRAPTDVALRAASTLLTVVQITLVCIGLLLVHHIYRAGAGLSVLLRGDGSREKRILLWIGAVALPLGLVDLMSPERIPGLFPWASPLIAFGAGMIVYAVWLSIPQIHDARMKILVTVLMTALLLIGASRHAGHDGASRAAERIKGFPDTLRRDYVQVYSKKNLLLGLDDNRVTTCSVKDANAAYHYVYGNLIRLTYSDHTYFLVVSQWKQGDPVINLRESDDVRFTLGKPGSIEQKINDPIRPQECKVSAQEVTAPAE